VRKAEQRLWDTLRRRAPREAWIQRLENIVGEGWPDVYAVGTARRAVWIELKAPTRPKRSTTPLLGRQGLNPDQINWHLKAHSHGIPTFVLARDDTGELFLFPGEHAAKINGFDISTARLFSVADNWSDIFLMML